MLASEAPGEAQIALAHAIASPRWDELAASIAHEVNQPLAAVVANAEACLRWLDREPRPERSSPIGRMDHQRRQSGERGDPACAFAREQDRVEKLPLDVNEVAREVITLVRRELINHQVALRIELAPALPMILGDRVQLQQVIINLVMNGIEAMQRSRIGRANW